MAGRCQEQFMRDENEEIEVKGNGEKWASAIKKGNQLYFVLRHFFFIW
jgi:hypothetical protein